MGRQNCESKANSKEWRKVTFPSIQHLKLHLLTGHKQMNRKRNKKGKLKRNSKRREKRNAEKAKELRNKIGRPVTQKKKKSSQSSKDEISHFCTIEGYPIVKQRITKKKLNKHIQNVHKRARYFCTVKKCMFSYYMGYGQFMGFTKQKYLLSHQRNNHATLVDGGKYRCNICLASNEFKTKLKIIKHMKENHMSGKPLVTQKAGSLESTTNKISSNEHFLHTSPNAVSSQEELPSNLDTESYSKADDLESNTDTSSICEDSDYEEFMESSRNTSSAQEDRLSNPDTESSEKENLQPFSKFCELFAKGLNMK